MQNVEGKMNPVVGDEALLVSGRADKMTELEKIRCHLSFALEQLRGSSAVAATSIERNRRLELLLVLEGYINRGIFPRNENISAPNQRFPCFVDTLGTPCAVAHLMQASGAAPLVGEIIAVNQKYGTIAQIANDPALSPEIQSWAAANGISVSELALIQPTYEFYAVEARQLFAEIESELLAAAASPKNLTEDKIQSVCRLMVKFGDKMVSGYGEPQRDIPKYEKAMGELDEKIPSGSKLERLAKLLRKEVDGSRGTCNAVRTNREDYEGLLSDADLEAWNGHISNRRLR